MRGLIGWSQNRGDAPSPALPTRRRIEREQLLRGADAAQRITPDRDELAFGAAGGLSEARREQQRLLDRAAHRGDAADFIDGRTNDREIETLFAADIAVEHLAEMQRQINVGDGKLVAGAPAIQF